MEQLDFVSTKETKIKIKKKKTNTERHNRKPHTQTSKQTKISKVIA